MTGYDSKRQMAANKLWDRPSVAFDEWWNHDHDESTNPFRPDSGAYWAWAGWKAALAQPAQEPVAWRNAAIRLGEELSSVGPDGYYCVVCGKFLPANEYGVITHDDVPHPIDMDFEDEEKPQ